MSSDEETESSPFTSWNRPTETDHAELSLGEFIDEFREELDAIAEEAHVISPVVQALLDHHDRGD